MQVCVPIVWACAGGCMAWQLCSRASVSVTGSLAATAAVSYRSSRAGPATETRARHCRGHYHLPCDWRHVRRPHGGRAAKYNDFPAARPRAVTWHDRQRQPSISPVICRYVGVPRRNRYIQNVCCLTRHRLGYWRTLECLGGLSRPPAISRTVVCRESCEAAFESSRQDAPESLYPRFAGGALSAPTFSAEL